MLRSLLPWALAGLAGYFVPRAIHVREDWYRTVLAAIAGAAVGWISWHL